MFDPFWIRHGVSNEKVSFILMKPIGGWINAQCEGLRPLDVDPSGHI